ncbi:hypothetical protein ACIQU4_29115 [Streptomyces sp. NPDC090741]|uniref:hypothetical protein n=1 Tax=Streptomyces sp. NPDC090741 TaxID=3365967 RepID=UPI0037FED8E1
MRKFTAATAAAGAVLMIGATASTASADDVFDPKPWDASVAGAYGSGTMTTVWKDGIGGTVTATGKLTVTDPKACYTISVGAAYMGKPRGPQVWHKSPQKQCGPGTLDITAVLGPMNYWDGPWVTICKDGDESRACKR